MKQSLILGIGTGRCGLASLAAILRQQPDTACFHGHGPLLPWRKPDDESAIRDRFARFRRVANVQWLTDVAHFYLPYLDEISKPSPRFVLSVCNALKKKSSRASADR